MLKAGLPGLGLLELGYVGVPCALVGVAYMMWVAPRLLPERKELLEQLVEARREYLIEMTVKPGCRLIGRSIEAAGLRHLPGLFLIEIDRDGELISPVTPEEEIQAGDRLVFTGIVGTIVELEKIPGLVPAADRAYDLSPAGRRERRLCEAVISPTSPLVGQRVRDADFRAIYDAAIVAVHRNGARLAKKVGDVILRPGDTLLMQVGPDFSRTYRNHRDFYPVSDVEGSQPLRHERAWVAVALFAALIAAMVSGVVDEVLAALLAAGLMVVTRCMSAAEAHRSVEWPVLVTIAAAFGVGSALSESGAARAIADVLVEATRGLGPTATLAALYFGTMVLNELITNNAAAALAFPLTLEAAALMGVDARPLLIGITLASSLAFASPIGYQTHMMVYGPGGYRFTDFVRVGVPLNLLLWINRVLLIPRIWPW